MIKKNKNREMNIKNEISLLIQIKALTEHLTQEERNEFFDIMIQKRRKMKKESLFTLQKIRNEMDIDMQESGMDQGEVEGCLNYWHNKYLIVNRPK